MFEQIIVENIACDTVQEVDEDSDIEMRQRATSLHCRRSHLDSDNLRPQSFCDSRAVDSSAPSYHMLTLNSTGGHPLRSAPSSTFRPPAVLLSFT